MAKKSVFVKEVQSLIDNETIILSDDAMEFWKEFITPAREVTENGAKVLQWMQKQTQEGEVSFTANVIGNGIFASSRQVVGYVSSLVKKGYVDKTGKSPVSYSLTDKGKEFSVEN